MRAASNSRPQADDLTISQLAERTGVPIPTIKFYIREGLLERPRTPRGRTQGRYDRAVVRHIEAIRQLRTRHRLSVREIGALFDEVGPEEALSTFELRQRARQRMDAAIDKSAAAPPVSAEQLQQRSGLPDEDIEGLCRHGLLTPVVLDAATVYSEIDARIAEVVGALRRSGYQEQLGFSVADLSRYVEMIRALVVREVEQFDSPRLRSLPQAEMLRLVEQGLLHIDVLCGLLHKKLLLAAVHDRLDPG